MFMGDHGWYLQVALRVSRGEVLYRDVAWAYGPLPAVALAAAFRWLGPEAGWATALNALLAGVSLLLTYAALRSLLRPYAALALVAFAALAGPHVGGDLIRSHLYTYTQAVGWGMTTSLAALVAALRWQRAPARRWAVAAGVSVGLAFLSKPEFGVIAAGAALAVLAASRATARPWLVALTAAAVTLALGFGWQASASGWQPLWRGYTGYDLLAQGRFWGAGLGPRRWLGSIACFWSALAAVGVGRRWRRWRPAAFPAAILALAAAGVLIAPVVQEAGTTAWALGRVLQWLAAVSWAPLTPALVAAGFLGRRFRPPPAWWGLWALALLANLRPLLTGYSSGLALAPGLAVLGWLAQRMAPELSEPVHLPPAAPRRLGMKSERGQPGEFSGLVRVLFSGGKGSTWTAAALLAGLAAATLLAQALTPDAAFSAPRRWLRTDVGPVAVWDGPGAAAMVAVQAELERRVPAGETIFATGWGPGWYLLAGRANPAAFDVVLEGLGASGPEADRLQETLRQHPPAAVLVPVEQWQPLPGPPRRSRDRDAQAMRQGLGVWWEALAHDTVEATPAGVTDWVLLVRTGGP